MGSEPIRVILKDVIEINPKRDLEKGQISPYIPMANLEENKRKIQQVEEREYKGSGSRFMNGDTLFARITPCLENGKTAFVDVLSENEVAHGSTEFIVFRGKEGVTDNLFVYYLARSDRFRRYAIKSMTGTSGRQRVQTGSIENYEFQLPSLNKQKQIAHILGTLDDKIELNQQMNETLEAIARAIFKSWFVDFDPVRAKMAGEPYPLPDAIMSLFPDELVESELGLIPKGWKVTKLDKLCSKPQYGYTESATDEDTGVKFLRITDINKTPWVEWSTVPYCKIEPEDFRKYKVDVGDLLIARIADPGHSTIIENDISAVFASYLIRFIPNNNTHQRYLQYWMRSKSYWNLVKSRMTGSTRNNLNATVLKGFEIIQPSIDLIIIFDNIISSLREIINNFLLENVTLKEIREMLLNEIFYKRS